VVSLWGWLFKAAQRWMLLIPYRVKHGGEIHRIFTAAWAHANLSHLFFNMLALYFFAGQTTQILGTPRFLILYMTAVIVGFVPSTLFNLDNPKFATLGASGAVAAVMFSAILLHPNIKLYLLVFPLPVPAVVFAALWLAYSVWHSLDAGDGVNHDAHISGALWGSLLTFLFEPARVERSIKILIHFTEKVR
jgi:membrane associated rhomboid family serine protease